MNQYHKCELTHWGQVEILVIIGPANGLVPDGTKPLPEPTRTPSFWDTPRHPMITHTSDSHQIPSQNKTKLKLQFLKKLPKILKCCKELHIDTPSEVAW